MKKSSGGERGEITLNSMELKLFTAAENTVTIFSFAIIEKRAFRKACVVSLCLNDF